MSDNESIDELEELMAEYEAKEDEDAPVNAGDNNNDAPITQKYSNAFAAPTPTETPMDKVLFGDKANLLEQLAKAVGEKSNIVKEEATDEEEVNETSTYAEVTDSTRKRKAKKRKPVWTDNDDIEIQVGEVKRETRHTGPLDHLRKDKSYKEYLTARFTSIVAQPKWASLDRKKDDDINSDDEELLHSVGFLAKPAASTLAAHHLQYKRLKDLNRATYAEGTINSIQFHPSSTAAMVAGETGIATIYSIDGHKNEKLHSMRFQNFPIRCAKIKPCGTKAIFGSARHYYYSYDLLIAQESRYILPRDVARLDNFQLSPCGRYMAAAGRYGLLHLFDANSQELIHSFKQEQCVASMCFTADSRRLICNSFSSDMNILSLRTQRIEHTFIDDGCIRGSALDLSPNQRLLATGSMEGVVNVYDFEKVQSTKMPQPEKRILNLTTAVADVKFNHTSELLAMTSDQVNAAVKMVHFPSGTVYANFPDFKSDMGKVRTLEFSPASGYLALGDRLKAVSLFRLKHFNNY